MVQVHRLYSPGRIDRAGKILINTDAPTVEMGQALTVMDNWRAAHSYPLEIARKTLSERVNAVSPNAITAERLKRLESIKEKLTREPMMKLSTMQDIGGCRAVLRDVREAEELVRSYRDMQDLKITDYVANPRISGYRSIHLIWRFRSRDDPATADYNNMRIEIQIRTALQHTWATAVEIASTFTGYDLKSDHPKCSDMRWVRFFALMGGAMATREGGTPVPNTPTNRVDLLRELRNLSDDLKVHAMMRHWSELTNIRDDQRHADARLFLVTLRPYESQWFLKVKAYGANEAEKAAEDRINLERESRDARGVQVALVAVESIDMLKRAYPNYYADTTDFLKALQTALYGSSYPPPVIREYT